MLPAPSPPLLPPSSPLRRVVRDGAVVAPPLVGDRGRFAGRRKVTVFCCFADGRVAGSCSPALFIRSMGSIPFLVRPVSCWFSPAKVKIDCNPGSVGFVGVWSVTLYSGPDEQNGEIAITPRRGVGL